MCSSKKIWSNGTLTYTLTGLVVLFVFLLVGDFTWALRERSAGMIARIMLKKFGASDFLNGLIVVSIPTVIGLFLGPIISYKSDRHRGRWGRRIPFLALTTPIAVAGLAGMAFSPLIGQWLGEHFFGREHAILLSIAVFWILFEFGAIAANSIFSALINDVVPQELLGRFYGLFRIVSLAAGIIFNYWFLGKCETHYTMLFLGVGIIYGIGFTLLCLKVREGEYPDPPMPEDGRKGILGAAASYFRESFGHRYYVLVFIFLMVAGFVFMPVNIYCVFYAKQLNVTMDSYGKFIAYSYVISFALSYTLGVLADKFHPLRCGLVIMCIYAATSFLSGFCITDELTFATAVILHCVISGSYFTLTASLPLRLYPKSRFAQFSSAGGILVALGNMSIVPLVGKFFDWYGYDYRWLFYFGGIFAVTTVLLGLWLYRYFKQYGGVSNYTAPAV